MNILGSLKIALIFISGVFAHLSASVQQDCFSTPNLYSPEELAQELKERTLDMCWCLGQGSHFRFVSGNEEVYFEIYLGALPDGYRDFVSQIKDKFIESRVGETQQLIFSYKVTTDGREEINEPQCSQRQQTPDDYSYIVTDRRIIKNASPRCIDQEELATIIRSKNVLFYTGAGLSIASDVPSMRELHDLLGLEEGERFLFSLENALSNPREFASKILAFHKACLFSAPTKAHLALKELAIFKKIRLITENLDCLHEVSGIYPYRINAKHLRDEVGAESMTQFDYMICVGLSHDDRGFLGWYKQCNPEGKIIAVDLQQPSYLGDEDFLVLGDLQEVIPFVKTTILNQAGASDETGAG